MIEYEKPSMSVVRIEEDVITGSCDTMMPELCIAGDDE